MDKTLADAAPLGTTVDMSACNRSASWIQHSSFEYERTSSLGLQPAKPAWMP